MVKCAVRDYTYKSSIPGHPYLPEKYWLSQNEGRASTLAQLWSYSVTPTMTPHLNPTWILTSTLIVFQSYLPHDGGFFSNYPHSSLTPKPLDLILTLEEIQPCLLEAPCLCQRTGTGLGLTLTETEEVLTSSKQIQVPSLPNFLVTLFHQVPHLSCIPLSYHTSFPSTWKCFPISSSLKSLSSFSPS